MERSFEREIIPMARSEGNALVYDAEDCILISIHV